MGCCSSAPAPAQSSTTDKPYTAVTASTPAACSHGPPAVVTFSSDTAQHSMGAGSATASEAGSEASRSSVVIQPVLQPSSQANPNVVHLEVQAVIPKGLKRTPTARASRGVATLARSSVSSRRLLEASVAPQGKLMSPAKAKRERTRRSLSSVEPGGLRRSTSQESKDGADASSTAKPASVSKEPSAASVEDPSVPSGLAAAGPTASGPTTAGLEQFVGYWVGGAVEGRDEFLKAMELPWILRKVAAMLPNFDIEFFLDADGLHSHAKTMGKVVEESYMEGGQSVKEFKGIKTIVTYHWDQNVLTYTVQKEAAPEEEANSRRWIEPDGKTMKAETNFRKTKNHPWARLMRTWTKDETARAG